MTRAVATDGRAADADGGPRLAAARSADGDLIAGLVRKDPAAWDHFLDAYGRLIASRAAAAIATLGPPRVSVEDASSEVIAALMRNDCAALRAFEGRAKLGTWLAVVTRRTTVRLWETNRRQSPPESTVPESALESAAADGPEIGERPVSTRQLRESLGQMSPADARVLSLFYLEGRSYREIAEEMRLSVNAVGPKLDRARKRLKSQLRKGMA